MRVLNATRSITLKSATPPLLVVLSSFHDDVTEVSFVWLGAIFILRKDLGVGGLFRKWLFSLTLCNENVLT